MKFLLVLALVGSAFSAFAQSASQLASEAQRAYISGDAETAKAKFQMVLQIDPTNVVARNYLRIIQTQEKKSGAGVQLEKKLSTVILPTVKFQDATFGTALEYLKQQAAKQSAQVSFVTQLPQEALDNKVTLNLSNVPFTEALRYLCELNNAKYSIERYAILIKKAGAEAASGASPSAAQ